MKLRLLGAAAGGGSPQWNCGCAICAAVRQDRIAHRTQASLAVSADGRDWLLLGASPDVRHQVDTPSLWPTRDGSPIRGVALPNGDVDAWAGLLTLREWAPLELFATKRVREDLLAGNAALGTLNRFEGQSRWHDLEAGTPLPFRDGALTIEALPLLGQPPLHLRAQRKADPLDNAALIVRHGARAIAWCPSVAEPTPALAKLLDEVDVAFFDGTFFTDDELVRQGRSDKRARDMGHWPLDQSLLWLAARGAQRKVLVHINNTNPILIDSPARQRVVDHHVEVGSDGWELTL